MAELQELHNSGHTVISAEVKVMYLVFRGIRIQGNDVSDIIGEVTLGFAPHPLDEIVDKFLRGVSEVEHCGMYSLVSNSSATDRNSFHYGIA
jgi:hypothetical protein